MQGANQAAGWTSTVMALLASLPTWAQIVGGLVTLAGLAGGVFLRLRKQNGAAKAAPAPPAQPPPAQPPAPPSNSLSNLWKSFLASQPRAARGYPVFVVLGDAGAGKTHLIDARIDLQKQKAKFKKSADASPLLQMYPGDDLLVLEVSSTILHATDDATKASVTSLWEAIAGQAPTAVIALDATALTTGTPDSVQELGQLVRGKLDLLSAVTKQPVCVRLCLTHVDEIEGYTDLAAILAAQGVDQPLKIGTDLSAAGLYTSIAPLEAYLPYALKSPPVAGFARVVHFFDGMRAVLAGLSPFVEALTAPDDGSMAPVLRGLSLSAENSKDHLGEPFLVDAQIVAALAADEAASERRVRSICIGALVFTAALMALFYGYDTYRLVQAEGAVTRFAKSPDPASEQRAGEALSELKSAESIWPLLPYTSTSRKEAARQRFVDAIRTTWLLPDLDGKLDVYRLAWATGLVYASRGNDLGALVGKVGGATWAGRIGVPATVPQDYVDNSDAAWTGTTAPKPLKPANPTSPATDLDVWYDYLQSLDGAFGLDELDAAKLADLQKRAGPLVDVLDHAKWYPTTKEILGDLSQAKRVDVKAVFGALASAPTAPPWVNDNHDTLAGLLSLVTDARLRPTQVSGLSLSQLLNILSPPPPPASASASAAPSASAPADAGPDASAPAAPAAPAPPPDVVYRLTLNERTFSFDTKTWSDLLAHSQMGLLVDAFMQQGRSPFFSGDVAYPDVGRADVPGKGAGTPLQGIYTKTAFDAEVKPPLGRLDAALAAAPLSSAKKSVLRTYVVAQTAAYASSYQGALMSYYGSFQLRPASEAALALEIGEMSLPSSFLTTFLATVANNAALDLDPGNAYTKPLGDALAGLSPIVTVMTPAKGSYPNLDAYVKLLAPLTTGAPAGSAGTDRSLADLLSPMGKAALDILNADPKASVMIAVQAWLDANGVTGGLAAPFVAPVSSAYGFGLAEIKPALAQSWQSILVQAQPALSRFPFTRDAKQDAAIADVTALFLPAKGTFWLSCASLIAPVCVQTNGVWSARTSPLGSPTLPKGMLGEINALAAMSRTLWTAEGKQAPIVLGVKPQPLPTEAIGGNVVTMAHLYSGNASAAAFNQQPNVLPFNIAWWDQGASWVSVTLLSPSAKGPEDPPPVTFNSTWSFYRLLNSAASYNNLVATWKVPVDDTGRTTTPIAFELTSDPWSIVTVTGAPAAP